MSKASAVDRVVSVRALQELLQNVCSEPGELDTVNFISVLSSQGALAAFSDADRDIHPCSLNTFKRACSQLPGGFEAFNNLRLRALRALQEKELTNHCAQPTKKRQLQNRVVELQRRLDCATEDLLLLTRILDRSMRQSRQYARDSKSETILERCMRDQSEIRDLLTLKQSGLVALHVVVKAAQNDV